MDTNTVISGLFWEGAPYRVYNAARQQRFELLTSDAIFAELSDVIQRQKFAKLLENVGSSGEAALRDYQDIAVFVEAASEVPYPVRDIKVRMVVACALGGNADYLISGDHDLRVLKRVGDTQILNAAEFLAVLER